MAYVKWTPERLEIWHNMSPEDRDYDRVMTGLYPPGQGHVETTKWREYLDEVAETHEDRMEQHSCSCHLNPPCSHCTDCPKCNCVRCDDWHDYRDGETCPHESEDVD